MKAVSLFTGVGGMDLAFERAGVETVLQAERDPWCVKVLERHWPRVRRVDDVGRVGSGAASAGSCLPAADVAHTLDQVQGQAVMVANPLGAHHGRMDLDHDTYVPEIVSQAMSAKWAKGSSGPAGDETVNMVGTGGGVRRLTPTECERLQGFPDGWTAGQADSHRYRQMGNAVAVPVVEWIARRLVAVDQWGEPGPVEGRGHDTH